MTMERAVRRELTVPHAPATRSAGWGDWYGEVMALTKRWYILLIRQRLELVFTLVQPALWLVFFGSSVGRAVNKHVIGTSDYLGFVLPGMIAFTIVAGGVAGAMPLLWDKEVGYLDKLMSMPIARSSVILSRVVYQLGLSSVQVLLILLVAFGIGVRIAAGVPGVLAILAAAGLLTLAVIAAFAALAYAVPHHGTFFAISGFITLPLLFISNAFVPVHAMPGWMGMIARVNPLTYAIQSMRILVLQGWTADLAGQLAVLTLFALACLAVGTDQFRRQTGERLDAK